MFLRPERAYVNENRQGCRDKSDESDEGMMPGASTVEHREWGRQEEGGQGAAAFRECYFGDGADCDGWENSGWRSTASSTT
jgi:hypothetical protein